MNGYKTKKQGRNARTDTAVDIAAYLIKQIRRDALGLVMCHSCPGKQRTNCTVAGRYAGTHAVVVSQAGPGVAPPRSLSPQLPTQPTQEHGHERVFACGWSRQPA